MPSFLSWIGLQTKDEPKQTTPQDDSLLLKNIDKLLDAKIKNAVLQMENIFALQHFFLTGELLPPFHAWPISPDFAMAIVRQLQAKNYDCILEFGSGSSTLIIAKSLQVLHRTETQHLVFEHKEDYRAKTEQLVRSCTRSNFHLIHTPLIPWKENDTTWSYYDCTEQMKACAERVSNRRPLRILAVVDGPPGATCAMARYPALPHILSAYPTVDELTILLDDADRDDEKHTGEAWLSLLQTNGFIAKSTHLAFEKGAVLLEATRDTSRSEENPPQDQTA